jgi:hypothetical protein
VNGTQCGSPALRRKRFCYFHDNYRQTQARLLAEESNVRMGNFPLLEDANSVQVAVMHVIHLLGAGKMDNKVAGLMLFALQTASANIQRVSFEVEKVTDVVIDQDTLDLTCIHGPQWFERDFEEKSTEKNEAAPSVNREELCGKTANARKKPDPLKDAPEDAFTKILQRFALASENAGKAIERESPPPVIEADSLRN